MESRREFYPMISSTMKSILNFTDSVDLSHIIKIIINYPNYTTDNSMLDKMVIDELNRQYTRWNKGGKNA